MNNRKALSLIAENSLLTFKQGPKIFAKAAFGVSVVLIAQYIGLVVLSVSEGNYLVSLAAFPVLLVVIAMWLSLWWQSRTLLRSLSDGLLSDYRVEQKLIENINQLPSSLKSEDGKLSLSEYRSHVDYYSQITERVNASISSDEPPVETLLSSRLFLSRRAMNLIFVCTGVASLLLFSLH